MNARRSSAVNVLATGVFVLIVTVLVLFSARWGCESARHSLLPTHLWHLTVDASAMPSFKTGNDPNGRPHVFHAVAAPDDVDKEALGVAQYQQAQDLEAPDSPVYVWGGTGDDAVRLYYDRSLHLIVYAYRVQVPQPHRIVITYAGPAGVAETPDAKLGRFGDPMVRLIGGNLDRPIVYDRGLRRFFAIDWRGRAVKQGPVVSPNFAAPVDFGRPVKQPRCLQLYLDTRDPFYTYGLKSERTLVLDAAGGIRMLDLDTLQYCGIGRKLNADTLMSDSLAGQLPAPDTLFGPVRSARPQDLFAFSVLPVFLGDGETYAGCAVAVLSRDATAMKLEVFDANGAGVAMTREPGDFANRRNLAPLSRVAALYYRAPGGAVLSAAKFILESLHPPVLLWLSYFTASNVEAVAGHRAMFVLPNSFAAMRARNVGLWWLPRFMTTLPFLMPGLALGVVLAAVVGRDARRTGLPARARRLWIAATVLFALPAYFTYRITRPTTGRVTCRNCGRDRWVDRETCHHCGSPWVVPELIPPTWRVIGRPEEQACDDPAPRPEETISNESEV